MTGGSEAQIDFANNIRYRILSKIFYAKYFRKIMSYYKKLEKKLKE